MISPSEEEVIKASESAVMSSLAESSQTETRAALNDKTLKRQSKTAELHTRESLLGRQLFLYNVRISV